MKRLRPTVEEKVSLIGDLTERLSQYNKGTLEDLKIDDLLKAHSKIPSNVRKPIIQVTAEAYMGMLELINQSAVECSWHGLVQKNGDVYTIYGLLVFPQRNSATSTTTDEKEFAEWQTQLILDPDFPIEHLRMHGHSHVNMNVFSSGVDDQYQKDLIAKVDNGDYYIFMIMNKKMELCIFLYDFEQQVLFEKGDIDFRIISSLNDPRDIRAWAKGELKEKAITQRPATAKPYERTPSYFDDEYDSYFSRITPIFKGANNGSK